MQDTKYFICILIWKLYTSYRNDDPESGFAAYDENVLFFPKGEGKYFDAFYPLDIRSTDIYTEKFGDFYGENDFVGEYSQSNYLFGLGAGSGLIQGYTRGWGYTQLGVKFGGAGVDIALSAGKITGNFLGKGKLTPKTLAGPGRTTSTGALIFESGTWYGFDSEGNVSWKGEFEGYSASPAIISGSDVDTDTKLKFPGVELRGE